MPDVECILQGLDSLRVKLAVVSNKTRSGSVVLAATPKLKKVIRNGCRLYDIPNEEDIIIVNPQMK